MKTFTANIMQPIEVATVTVEEHRVIIQTAGDGAKAITFLRDNFLAFAEAVARAKAEVELQQRIASNEPINREFSPDSAQRQLPGPWNDFHANAERELRSMTEQH